MPQCKYVVHTILIFFSFSCKIFFKLFFHFLKSFIYGSNNNAVLQLLIFALPTVSMLHLSFIACALLPVDLILFKLFCIFFN